MNALTSCPFSRLPAFITILMMVACSCVKNVEDVYPVSYNVTNNSDYQIKVIFNDLLKISGYMTYYTRVKDSVIVIEPGKQKTLFVALWYLYNGQNPEHDTILRCMKTLRVYRSDTVQSTTNFLLTKYWVFSRAPRASFDYSLSVSTSDFNH